MLIQPYILQKDGSKELLSHRELRTTSEGFAIARYRKKLLYISDQYRFLLDYELPDQNDYFFPKSYHEEIKFKENVSPPVNAKITLPQPDFLYFFAQLGVDAAVIALRELSQENRSIYPIFQRAAKLRFRYKEYQNASDQEHNKSFQNLISLDPEVSMLASRYLAYPMNGGHFLTSIISTPIFRAHNYLNSNFNDLKFPKQIRPKTARKYLDANLFFHQAVFKENPCNFVERDQLKYSEFTENREKAFYTKSKELVRYTQNWRKNTKLKFVKMGDEVKLRFSKDGKNYPHSTEKIANLSIITLAGLKHDSMTTKRILDLHKMGIRQIGHLAQFT